MKEEKKCCCACGNEVVESTGYCQNCGEVTLPQDRMTETECKIRFGGWTPLIVHQNTYPDITFAIQPEEIKEIHFYPEMIALKKKDGTVERLYHDICGGW